jgi:hypothetical protein
MTAPMVPASIRTMLDRREIVLCDHDREPRKCPICGGQKPEHRVFDPNMWVERYRAASRETAAIPDELAGMPLH